MAKETYKRMYNLTSHQGNAHLGAFPKGLFMKNRKFKAVPQSYAEYFTPHFQGVCKYALTGWSEKI